MIGEFLYQLNPQERTGGAAYQWFARSQINTDTDTLVDAVIQVPEGFYLVAQNICGYAIPDAGQVVDQVVLTILDTAQNFLIRMQNRTSTTAGETVFAEVPSPIFVPPRYHIRARGQFDSGVNNNSTELNIVGLLIPRGNIQLS